MKYNKNNIFNEDNFKKFKKTSGSNHDVDKYITYPILSAIANEFSNLHNVIKANKLSDSLFSIGNMKIQASNIPDWIYTIEDKPIMISKSIGKSKQFYNPFTKDILKYLIHPRIQASYIVLCNGDEFRIYNIFNHDYISFNYSDFTNSYYSTVDKIHNLFMIHNNLLNKYKIDLGNIVSYLTSNNTNTVFEFEINNMADLLKVNSNIYSLNANIALSNINFLGTFDFDDNLFNKLLSALPRQIRRRINSYFSQYPQCKLSNICNISIKIKAQLNTKSFNGYFETYKPFDVIDFY